MRQLPVYGQLGLPAHQCNDTGRLTPPARRPPTSDPRPMPYRKRAAFVLVLAAAYWVVLFVLTHLPIRMPASLAGFDKLQHAIAFCGLAVLLCTAAGLFWPLSKRLLIGVLLVIAAYAALDEISQGWVRYRTPDPWDWCADLVGASLGVALYAVVRKRWSKTRDAAEVDS